MKNIVLKIFISIFCIALIGWSLLPFKEDIFPTNIPIEKASQQKDSLNKSNVLIDSKIQTNEKVSDSLQHLLSRQQIELVTIKKSQNEKAITIKHTTDMELLEFFSKFNTEAASY